MQWARRQKYLKPDVIRTGWLYMRQVDGAKVTRLTPGGLLFCLRATGSVKSRDGATEVSRGHSSRAGWAMKGRMERAEPRCDVR